MIEFIELNENKTGIKFLSKYMEEKTIVVSVSDGYTGLNLWKDKIKISPNTYYFFSSDIFSYERNFEIYNEDEDEKLFSLYIAVDNYPSIQKQDKLNILKSYKYDHLEQGVGLPVFEIFLNKAYENSDVHIKENDIVFDVGGNIGIFSYYAICKNAKEVHTFEPGIKQFESIEKNIINKFDNVYGNNCAVGKEEGSTNLYISDVSSVVNSTTNLSNNFYEVDLVNIEDYADKNKIKKIDFLKIDCEGCEYEVIESLSDNFLKTRINKIVMEYHKDLNDNDTTLLIKRLEENGFINTIKGDIIYSNKKYN
jgi:FkbM family methyltransferase